MYYIKDFAVEGTGDERSGAIGADIAEYGSSLVSEGHVLPLEVGDGCSVGMSVGILFLGIGDFIVINA